MGGFLQGFLLGFLFGVPFGVSFWGSLLGFVSVPFEGSSKGSRRSGQDTPSALLWSSLEGNGGCIRDLEVRIYRVPTKVVGSFWTKRSLQRRGLHILNHTVIVMT